MQVQSLFRIHQLIQEFLGQIAGGEIPEMIAAGKGEGQAEQLVLRNALLAVAGQGGNGKAGHVDGADAADHVVAEVAFRAEDAGALHVNGNGAAGQFLDSLGEVRRNLADNGSVQRVHFRVHQGHRRITGSIRCFGHRATEDADEQSGHHET